jgi:hypothetical protein
MPTRRPVSRHAPSSGASGAARAPEQAPTRDGRSAPSGLLDLQRHAGNRAAGELLQSGGSAARAAHGMLQGHAQDLEEEANRLAAQVIDTPAGEVRTPSAPAQIRSDVAGPVPAIVEHVLRSSGEPLDPATRASLEPRLGRDLSNVQVHTDAQAVESARALDATAYASGQHVVFDASAYDPSTTPGLRLLAHELTHTIQQSGAPSASGTPVIQRTPNDAPKLPWYQQAQLEALEGMIDDWTEDEKTIVRALLRKWIDLQNKKIPQRAIAAQVQDELLERYYRPWLQAQDAAVQKYCREHDLGPRERFGGGISCEPLFTGERQLGEGRLEDMRSYMKVTGPREDEPPLHVVHQWVREYRNRTNADKLREAGIIMDVLGLVTAFATPGGKPLSPAPRVPSEPPATPKQLPAPTPPKGQVAKSTPVTGPVEVTPPAQPPVKPPAETSPAPAAAKSPTAAPPTPSKAPTSEAPTSAPAPPKTKAPAKAPGAPKASKPPQAQGPKPVKIATSTKKTTRKHAVKYPPVEHARPGRERPSVDPGPEKAAQIKSAEQLHETATESVAGLPRSKQSKTVAAGEEGQRMSGWKHIPESDVKATPRAVEEHSREIGHTLDPSKNDQVGQGGFPGQYHASHAEKQQIVARPNTTVGVSRPMCNDCVRFFKREAAFRGKTQTVSDPQCTREFHPDGTITEYWRDGTIVRLDASGSAIAQPPKARTP